MTEFDKPSLWQRVAPLLRGFDFWLLLFVGMLASAGLIAMYSSGFDHGTRFTDHGRNMLIAAAILFVVAQIPPQQLMKVAVPLYMLGVALLVAVALFGITKKGAQRWVNVGVVIQPSELLKIATPLMLAWYFQKFEGRIGWKDFALAAVLIAVPTFLIKRQPDLGTSLLILAFIYLFKLKFDVSRLKRKLAAKKDNQLGFYSLHDDISGFPNKFFLQQQLDSLLKRAPEQCYSLLLIKISQFEQVNQLLGHSNSNLILAQIAQRINEQLHSADTALTFEFRQQRPIRLCHLGGVDFAIWLECNDKQHLAEFVADELERSVPEPMVKARLPRTSKLKP